MNFTCTETGIFRDNLTIPWLLVTWLLVSPRHQQDDRRTLVYHDKESNYLCQLCVEKWWWNANVCLYVSWKRFGDIWVDTMAMVALVTESTNVTFSFQGWALLIFILIMMSIAVVTMKTHPYFRVPKPGNYTALQNFTNPKEALFYLTEPHFTIKLIETICMFIFIVELLLRFSAAPKKCRWVYNRACHPSGHYWDH